MVRLVVIITLVGALFFCACTVAQGRGFGLGIILGEPTGISFKKWREGASAIGGGLAWSFDKKKVLHLHADYLLHKFDILQIEKGKLAPYYGIGGRIKITPNETRVGVRIPLGINYIFERLPLDIFLEFAALLDLVPSTNFELDGGIGIRYFF